jgi:hypothetical protein
VDRQLKVSTIFFGMKLLTIFQKEDKSREDGQEEAEEVIYAKGSRNYTTWVELSDGVSGDCPKLLCVAFNSE